MFGSAHLVGLAGELDRLDGYVSLSGEIAGLAMSLRVAHKNSWVHELIYG